MRCKVCGNEMEKKRNMKGEYYYICPVCGSTANKPSDSEKIQESVLVRKPL